MIHYDYNKMLVQQHVSTLSLYDFEGSFDEVMKRLKESKKYHTDEFVKNTKKMGGGTYWPNKYIDNAESRVVKFDRLFLQLAEEDGDKVIQIWGERKFDAAELAAHQKEQEEQKIKKEEQDRKEYTRLKKQFEGVKDLS